MNKSLALKNKLYLFLFLTISLFTFVYLFYFLINGDRGVISYLKTKNENSISEKKLSLLTSKNDDLINKIEGLQTNTISLDYLDEKVREKIGYSDTNEIIVKFD